MIFLSAVYIWSGVPSWWLYLPLVGTHYIFFLSSEFLPVPLFFHCSSSWEIASFIRKKACTKLGQTNDHPFSSSAVLFKARREVLLPSDSTGRWEGISRFHEWVSCLKRRHLRAVFLAHYYNFSPLKDWVACRVVLLHAYFFFLFFFSMNEFLCTHILRPKLLGILQNEFLIFWNSSTVISRP